MGPEAEGTSNPAKSHERKNIRCDCVLVKELELRYHGLGLRDEEKTICFTCSGNFDEVRSQEPR